MTAINAIDIAEQLVSIIKRPYKAKNLRAWVNASGAVETQAIGDASTPFVSIQAAYAAGARDFTLGPDSVAWQAGDLECTGFNTNLYFRGLSGSRVGAITTTTAAPILWIYSDGVVEFGAITANAAGVPGVDAGEFGENESPPGNDGLASIVRLFDCVGGDGATVTVTGGQGGTGGTGSAANLQGADGGVGGRGGAATLAASGCSGFLYAVNAGVVGEGGAGGAGNDNNGNEGPAGPAGVRTLTETASTMLDVRRLYVVDYDLREMKLAKVSIVPRGVVTTRAGRGFVTDEIEIDLALQKSTSSTAHNDALMRLSDEMIGLFEFLDLPDDSAKHIKTERKFIYDAEGLKTKKLFTSLATMTFSLNR